MTMKLDDISSEPVIKATLNNIKRILKLVSANIKAGKEDHYDGLTFSQVTCLYEHACKKYFTTGAKSFVYADSQSDYAYIRVKLLYKYLDMLSKMWGRESAVEEYKRLQGCGYFHFAELRGEPVICTGEGLTRVRLLNQGIHHLENAKPIQV